VLLFPTIWLLPVAVMTGLLVLAAVVSGVEGKSDGGAASRPPARYCRCCETAHALSQVHAARRPTTPDAAA
jgi:hypothetical protein